MSPPSDSGRLPHPVNDLGGLPGEPIVIVEHELARGRNAATRPWSA